MNVISQIFLANLTDLFSIQQKNEVIDFKLLITCRSESDILNELNHLRELIHIDSDKINADLLNYIQTRVNEFFMKKKYSLKLK